MPATQSIGGFWRVRAPYTVSISPGSATYGDVTDNVCRFDVTAARLRAICLPHLSRRGLGDGTVDGNAFHIEWSGGMQTIILNGNQDRAGHFKAGLRAGMLGLGLTQAIPVFGQRIAPDSEAASDQDPKAASIHALLADLARGGDLSTRETPTLAAELRADPPFSAAELAMLGSVEALVAIGTVDAPVMADRPAEHYNVYDVEFANDHRICGIDLSASGEATAFQCR